MDFTFDADQQEIKALAARILADHATPERLRAAEAAGEGADRDLHAAMAKAGLVGLPFREDAGGAGLGFLEACIVIEEIGRRAAPVPYLETVVAGMAVERFGTDEQRRALLPAVVDGSAVVTVALAEEQPAPLRPAATAAPDGAGGWRLDGVKVCVPSGLDAAHLLVPAAIAGGGDGAGDDDGSTAVFVVDGDARGLAKVRQETSAGRTEARLELDGVAGEPLGDPAAGAGEVLPWLVDRATAALCVLAVGVCDEALRLTAAYVQERQQFGRPLASFQAVGQRAADAYVDAQAVRLTAWQAAWRLSAGLPATDEVAIAKFWASEGGQRVVHAAQHLHGGVGVDRSYPLHRYFLLAKQIDLSLGSGSTQLAAIGRRLAAAGA